MWQYIWESSPASTSVYEFVIKASAIKLIQGSQFVNESYGTIFLVDQDEGMARIIMIKKINFYLSKTVQKSYTNLEQ